MNKHKSKAIKIESQIYELAVYFGLERVSVKKQRRIQESKQRWHFLMKQ